MSFATCRASHAWRGLTDARRHRRSASWEPQGSAIFGGVREHVLVTTLRKGDIGIMGKLRRGGGLQETCG